jgi:glutaredoxin
VSTRIVLYTRGGCHLCDDAKAALGRIRAATGVDWSEVDISTDPELTAEYGDRIPVVVLDGREHGYWRVEEDRLLRDLAA